MLVANKTNQHEPAPNTTTQTKKVRGNKSSEASFVSTLIEDDYESSRIVFRHSGARPQNCPCPNCKCPGCPCALGLCGCSKMALATTLSQQDIADDMGLLLAKVVNGKLHVVFKERTAALSDGTLPVSGDIYLETDLINALNTPDLKILGGTYQVDFSRYPYGEAYLDIEYL
jgi:hypothetical protein